LSILFFVAKMIEQGQGIYYFTYALLVVALGIAYIRVKSTEGTVITTKEFRYAQTSFVSGYVGVILCELIASASFYHTLVSIHLSLLQITKLYIVTIIASTVGSIALEIVEIGTRKDKCVISALCYSISMFSMLFGGHYEMLLMGRILYGIANALQTSSFDSYAIHEHNSHGFPDDWLVHTFSLVTHGMALAAVLCGCVGQVAASLGPMGPTVLCSVLFAITAIYLLLVWEKDVNQSRFMLSGFVFNLQQAASTLTSNKTLLIFLTLSTLVESSILVFSFYWAPWLSLILSEEDEKLPFELVFACCVMMAMLGNYLFQMHGGGGLGGVTGGGVEGALQVLLLCSCASFVLGAMLQTSLLSFAACLLIQLSVGVYWPCVGSLRARLVPHELRSILLVLQKVAAVGLACLLLSLIHHSPFLLLSACAALDGLAVYFQTTQLDSKVIAEAVAAAEEEEPENEL